MAHAISIKSFQSPVSFYHIPAPARGRREDRAPRSPGGDEPGWVAPFPPTTGNKRANEQHRVEFSLPAKVFEDVVVVGKQTNKQTPQTSLKRIRKPPPAGQSRWTRERGRGRLLPALSGSALSAALLGCPPGGWSCLPSPISFLAGEDLGFGIPALHTLPLPPSTLPAPGSKGPRRGPTLLQELRGPLPGHRGRGCGGRGKTLPARECAGVFSSPCLPRESLDSF